MHHVLLYLGLFLQLCFHVHLVSLVRWSLCLWDILLPTFLSFFFKCVCMSAWVRKRFFLFINFFDFLDRIPFRYFLVCPQRFFYCFCCCCCFASSRHWISMCLFLSFFGLYLVFQLLGRLNRLLRFTCYNFNVER